MTHAGPLTTDLHNHGTTILSAAGGITYGVSKNANLIMVKVNYAPMQGVPHMAPQFGTETITDGLMFIMDDVRNQVNNNVLQRGKAVINVSLGEFHCHIISQLPINLYVRYGNDYCPGADTALNKIRVSLRLWQRSYYRREHVPVFTGTD